MAGFADGERRARRRGGCGGGREATDGAVALGERTTAAVAAPRLFASRRRHTGFDCGWSSDVCSSDLGGLLVTVIGVGTIAAYGVVRLADRYGRRGIMMVTILGYALFSGLTGLARGPYDFAAY